MPPVYGILPFISVTAKDICMKIGLLVFKHSLLLTWRISVCEVPHCACVGNEWNYDKKWRRLRTERESLKSSWLMGMVVLD